MEKLGKTAVFPGGYGQIGEIPQVCITCASHVHHICILLHVFFIIRLFNQTKNKQKLVYIQCLECIIYNIIQGFDVKIF